jgi:uncharacterized protein (DUF58 family)
MKWKINIAEDRNSPASQFFSLGVGLCCLLANSFFLGTILLIAFGILKVNQYYLNIAGSKLSLIDEKVRHRFRLGDEGIWSFTFKNEGMTIARGRLMIEFDDVVHPIGLPYEANFRLVDLSVPFKLKKGETVQLDIPIKANRRGVGRVKTIKIKIPGCFGSGFKELTYLKGVLSDVLVYPTIGMVFNQEIKNQLSPGYSFMPSSLYEDAMLPIGTRDYQSTDGMQKMNWKASARMQSLQTKVFSPAANRSWSLVLNVNDRYAITGKLEELIKSACYLIEEAFRLGIPFSLAINVRSFGKVPFYFLPEGEGKKQRQMALEMLSMLSINDMTISSSIMARYLTLHRMIAPTFIVLGNLEELNRPIQLLTRQGVAVQVLEHISGKDVVVPWKAQQLSHA